MQALLTSQQLHRQPRSVLGSGRITVRKQQSFHQQREQFPAGQRRLGCTRSRNRKNVQRRAAQEADLPALLGHRPIQQRSVYKRILAWLVDILPPLGSTEVLKRAAVTFFFMALIRLGAHMPLPGVDLSKIQAVDPGSRDAHAALDLLSSVPANIFMLGISPIFVGGMFSTLAAMFPKLFATKQRAGAEGAARSAARARVISCAVAIVLGTVKGVQLQPYVMPNTRGFIGSTAVTLAASTALLNHIADENEALGLGNGLTMMIALPMLQRQAKTFQLAWRAVQSGAIPLAKAALAVLGIGALVYLGLFVSLTETHHELTSYKIVAKQEKRSFERAGAARDLLPVRITPAGVSCLLMSSFYIQLALNTINFVNRSAGTALAAFLARPLVMPLALGGVAFVSVFVDFTFGRQTAATSLWMQHSDVGIKHNPPIVPGEPTRRFLERQQALAHFWGGLAVAALACCAHILDAACLAYIGIQFGATSTLLLSGFIMTAYRQVEALSELPKLARRLESEQQLLQNCQV